jgi:hypothetical protein
VEFSLRITEHVRVLLRFCGIQSVDQVLDHHLTRPEEEEEVSEHKATFLDALKGLEAARKCMCQFATENSIIIMCIEVESELYRLRGREKKKHKAVIE